MGEKTSVGENVRRFLSRTHRLLIHGAFVESLDSRTFPVENPALGAIISHAGRGTPLDIDRAVSAGRRALNGPFSKMTASERGRLLWKLADLMEANLEELAQLETLDNGKPLKVARAVDLPLAIDLFRYMAGWCTKISGKTFPVSVPYMPGRTYSAFTTRQPVGLVGQIIPWNFPLLMAAWKLGPALAAGCTVVLKPAEQTPLSAIRLGELCLEAGFPPGVINIVTGFGDIGAHLASHPEVDKVAFTGSSEVGRSIVAAASSSLKRVSLELGGKSPNIILEDADLDLAIPGAAHAIFFNHGQCCCAGSRLYVHEKLFDRVLDGLSRHAQSIRLGNGLDPETEMGPLVSREQLDRVCGYISSGIEEGAKIEAGGKCLDQEGYYLQPTVVTHTHSTMKVVREEIFGPVVVASPFRDLDSVVKEANDSPFGLAAAIWTRNVGRAHELTARLQAGTVWINCYNVFDASLPFGGFKQSGWGREMGQEAVELYLETKSVCIAHGA